MSPGNLLEVQSLGSYPRTMERGILSWGWSALTRSPGDADARSSLRTSGLNLYHQTLSTYGVTVFSLSYIGSPCTYYAPTQQSPLVLRWPTDVHKMAGNMVNRLRPEDPQRLFPVNMKKATVSRLWPTAHPSGTAVGMNSPSRKLLWGEGRDSILTPRSSTPGPWVGSWRGWGRVAADL